MHKTVIIHKADGLLGYHELKQIPRKGEWLELNDNTYEIKQVVWAIDKPHVRLIVDDLKH
jgi:hypothetical protein